MRTGSKRYKELAARLAQLERHLLGFLPVPPASRLSYTDAELDLARAYVVLAHAEIEAFCEQSVLAKVKSSKLTYDTKGLILPSTKRMVEYYVAVKGRSWIDCMNPPADVVKATFKFYLKIVERNHGIKRTNLERLLYPLGLIEAHLDSTWLASMNSFGSDRGSLAHRGFKAYQPPDPPSKRSMVNSLLQGLHHLDRRLAKMR